MTSLPNFRLASSARLVALTAVIAIGLFGCDRKPAAPAEPQQPAGEPTSAAPSVPAAAERAAAAPTVAEPPPTEQAEPLASFLDRKDPGDLRLVSYNVMWDSIFPNADHPTTERFQRVIKALDPDILLLQEINQNAESVAMLLNELAPLPDGSAWHVYKGHSNPIVSKYPLSMTADTTVPAVYTGEEFGDREARVAMALVDLPDDRFPIDLYVTNHHYKCCGDEGGREDNMRQHQSDAMVAWFADARTAGGEIDLPANTGLIIAGDLNMVGGLQPLTTAITGDIINEDAFGPDVAPDWDDSPLTDAHPLHNVTGPDDYTWRDDGSEYDPGRLDYVIYTDSVLEVVHKFVLNTTEMPDTMLAEEGLEALDVVVDQRGVKFDHLPLVVDFRVIAPE